MQITPDQLRMARALLRLSITGLAELAKIDKMVIVRMEAGRRAQASTVKKLRAALDEQGVVFVGAIEPLIEPTVALRFGTKAPPAADDEEEDLTDQTPSGPPIGALRGYWADLERWNRLSASGKNAMLRVLEWRGWTLLVLNSRHFASACLSRSRMVGLLLWDAVKQVGAAALSILYALDRQFHALLEMGQSLTSTRADAGKHQHEQNDRLRRPSP